jgi:flagellin-specific chaperone FliS
LLQAQVEQSEEILFEVESLLKELREAWQVLATGQAKVCLTDEELTQQASNDSSEEPRYSFVG